MNNVRVITDKVIDRSRSIWRMAEDQDRQTIKSALLDITLDAALELACEAMQLVEQYEWAGPARRFRVMRDLLTAWRRLIRNVKAVNADHPIHECHLYLTLLDSWGSRLDAYDKLFDQTTRAEVKQLYYERFGLRAGTRLIGADLTARKATRARVRDVLDTYYAV